MRGLKRPKLSVGQILAWADEHRARTGRWPGQAAGPVAAAPGEKWANIEQALWAGRRGLPGGDSLARLLARERGARNPRSRPRLTVEQILAWADAHHVRKRRWPTISSGPVLDAPGENWRAIYGALYDGHRGLPGGDTLSQLLERHGRGIRPPKRVRCPRRKRSAGAAPAPPGACSHPSA
jgi:hypothetical protein